MSNNFPSKETVARIRAQYPLDTRVELVSMNDPYSKLMPGDRGNVTGVDDAGTIFVDWDSGSGLGIVYGEDSVKKIEREIRYATGKEFWLDTVERYGFEEATGICQRYLGVHLRNLLGHEVEFCHELFVAMVEDPFTKADPAKIVYPYDFATAKDRAEEQLYHDSRKRNNDCAESIDAAIRDSHDLASNYNLHGAVRKVVSEYGFERVNRVMARLIQRHDYDGRYSYANKKWAAEFIVPEAAFDRAVMNAHPTLLNDFVKYLREMYTGINAIHFAPPSNPVAVEPTQISVRLVNAEQREADGAWLKLPATVEDLQAVFEHIRLFGPYDEGYIAVEFSSPYKGIAENLSPNDSLDELNMLASYIKDMESWEIDKLQAILTGKVADGVGNASGLINLLAADNFASFDIIGANNAEELGAYWLRELPDAVPESVTAAEYGAQCISEEKGAFTEWGYAYRRYDTTDEYDGIVPQEYLIVKNALFDLPRRVDDDYMKPNSTIAQLRASRQASPVPRKKKDDKDKDRHKPER